MTKKIEAGCGYHGGIADTSCLDCVSVVAERHDEERFGRALAAYEAEPSEMTANGVEWLMVERASKIMRGMNSPTSTLESLYRDSGRLMWIRRTGRAHGLELPDISQAVRLIESHPDFAGSPLASGARQYYEGQGATSEAALWGR